MKDFSDKAVFVTGGANGIGRSIAESFARSGSAVAIADINLEEARLTAEAIKATGARAIAVACDVTRQESIAEAADEATEALGPIHILVNNAGAFSVSPLEETKREDWEWLLEINVIGVVNGLHTFLPRMRAHGEPAHIINTASVSGHIPTPGLSVYTASKFAVVGLSECLKLELEDSSIGISILCPGIVKTGLIDSSRENRPERHGGSDAPAGVDMAAVVETGTDPSEIGDQVLEAVRAGEFYILTHSDLKPAFEARFKRIIDAY